MSFFLRLLQCLLGGDQSSPPEPPRSSSSQTRQSAQSSSSFIQSQSISSQTFQNSQTSSLIPTQSRSSQTLQSPQSSSLSMQSQSRSSQTLQSPQSSSLSMQSQSRSSQTFKSPQSSSSIPSQSTSSQTLQSPHGSSSIQSQPRLSQTLKSPQCSSSSIQTQSRSSQILQNPHSSFIPSQSRSSQTLQNPQSSSSVLSQSTSSKILQSPQSFSSIPSLSTSSQTLQSPQSSSSSIQSQLISYRTLKSHQCSSSSIQSQLRSSQTLQNSKSSSSVPSQSTSSKILQSPQSSSSIPSQSSPSQTWSIPQISSSTLPSSSSVKVPQNSTQLSPSSPFSFNEPPLSPSPFPSSSSSSPFSQKLPNLNPVLHESPSNASDQKGKKKTNFIWVEKGSLPKATVSSTCEPTQTSSYQTRPSSPQSSSPNLSPPSSPFSFNNGQPSPSPRKLPTFKHTLREGPQNAAYHKGKANYIWVEKGSQPLYMVPEVMKDVMKKEIVPEILKMPLSPLTYKDYFSALLYAEEYYFEKWSEYEMKNVTLKLKEAEISKRRNKHKYLNEDDEQDVRIFVELKIDSIPENRPFLLSRDFVYARPVGSQEDPFEGVIYRVKGRENLVLVEFEEEFYLQHDSAEKYDISFSFNRVCLKRAYQALESVSDNLFHNFLFPDCAALQMNFLTYSASGSHFLHHDHADTSSTVSQILSIQGSPPYLVSGPLCVPERKEFSYYNEPSKTGVVVCEAVVQIYKSSPEFRILVSAPSNSACDVLMRSLKKVIPESDMFRGNAAFREKYEVPEDILPSCLYREECFACPPLEELREFRVIFSTFMSSFRLHTEGIAAGHFSHIFLVDASFAIEPEALVTLANFADEHTAVVVTGRPGNSSSWVRSEIGRKMGLKISYFERLCQRWPYNTLNPKFFADLACKDSYSFR